MLDYLPSPMPSPPLLMPFAVYHAKLFYRRLAFVCAALFADADAAAMALRRHFRRLRRLRRHTLLMILAAPRFEMPPARCYFATPATPTLLRTPARCRLPLLLRWMMLLLLICC